MGVHCSECTDDFATKILCAKKLGEPNGNKDRWGGRSLALVIKRSNTAKSSTFLLLKQSTNQRNSHYKSMDQNHKLFHELNKIQKLRSNTPTKAPAAHFLLYASLSLRKIKIGIKLSNFRGTGSF